MCDGDVTRVARWYDLDVSNSSEASAWTVGQNKVVCFPKETLQHRDLGLIEELGSSKIGQRCLAGEEDRILFETRGTLFRTWGIPAQFASFAWLGLPDLVLFLVVVPFFVLLFGL